MLGEGGGEHVKHTRKKVIITTRLIPFPPVPVHKMCAKHAGWRRVELFTSSTLRVPSLLQQAWHQSPCNPNVSTMVAVFKCMWKKSVVLNKAELSEDGWTDIMGKHFSNWTPVLLGLHPVTADFSSFSSHLCLPICVKTRDYVLSMA